MVQKYLLALSMLMSMAASLAMDSKEKPTSSHFWQNLLVGSLTGAGEVTLNQPLVKIKNDIQQGKLSAKQFATYQLLATHTSTKTAGFYQKLMQLMGQDMVYIKSLLHPTVLYRGYPVNAGSMAPITALQVAVTGALTQWFKQQAPNSIVSDKDKAAAAFIAGALSAGVSTPAELVMLHQQNTGQGLYKTLKTVLNTKGVGGLYRGILLTALRDGGFTTGYMALGQIIREKLNVKTDNQLLAALSGGIPAGLIAAVVTQPCDTIKTRMQSADIPLSQATHQLYTQGGTGAFFKGLVPRGTRVISAITFMGWCTSSLNALFKK